MKEALVQTFVNLRANKLRSFLTMFGILWGIISVVVLSATGEGFRQGNEHVLRELGKNIGITWGGRTSQQAGGERAGRQIFLTADDAHAIQQQARLVAVATPELQRGGMKVKSRFNAAAPNVHGIEPSYQDIRTLDLESGRQLNWDDERQVRRVALIGADMSDQLFAKRNSLGEDITINGFRYTVVGKIRHKDQDSNYSGPDNDKIFVPFAAMAQDFPRPDAPRGVVSNIIVAPKQWVVDDLPRQLKQRTGRIDDIDWPLERDVRSVLARRHGFDPEDREAMWMWDTSVNSLMFGRMVDTMSQFFTAVGLHHAGARRRRRHEHHAHRRARADARDRRAEGARGHDREHHAAVLPRGVHDHPRERRARYGRGARPLRAREPRADARALQGHDPQPDARA